MMDEVWVLMQGDGKPWLERIDVDAHWHEEILRRAVVRGARRAELDPCWFQVFLVNLAWDGRYMQYVATERGTGIRLLNGCIVEASE